MGATELRIPSPGIGMLLKDLKPSSRKDRSSLNLDRPGYSVEDGGHRTGVEVKQLQELL